MVRARDQLAAVFVYLAVFEEVAQRPRPAAGARVRLVDRAREAGLLEAIGARDAGQPGSDDDDARLRAAPRASARKRGRPRQRSRTRRSAAGQRYRRGDPAAGTRAARGFLRPSVVRLRPRAGGVPPPR